MRYLAGVSDRFAAFRSARKGNKRPARAARARLRIESLEDRALLTALFVDAAHGHDANPGPAAQPFSSIPRAIAAADEYVSPGADHIIIKPGIYHGNLYINDADPLTLVGVTREPSDVVIQGWGYGNTIEVADSRQVTVLFAHVTGGEQGIQAGNSGSLTLYQVQVDGNWGDGLASQFVSRVNIYNSYFADNGGDGAEIAAADNISIINSAFHHNGENGLELNTNGEILLHAVTAHDNGGLFEVDRTVAPVALPAMEQLVPETGADEDAFDGDGVSIYNASEVTLRAGSFSGNYDDGVYLRHVGEIVIVNPSAEYNGENGVDVEESGSVSVKAGEYMANGDDGLELNAESIYVVNAVAQGNAGDGLDIDEAGRARITAGNFSDNRDNGLDLDYIGELWLTGVSAQRNGDESGDDGVAISKSGDIWLTGGSFLDNHQNGVDLNDVNSVHAKGVVAKGNHQDGFDVDGAGEVTVVGGLFSHNGQQGMDLDGFEDEPIYRVIINGATSSDNGDDGVAVQNAYIVAMQGGNYLRNGDIGVEIINANHILLENVLSRFNYRDGLAIGYDTETYPAIVEISRGQFSFNGHDGIHIEHAGLVELERVIGIGNAHDGLAVIGSGPVDLGGSIFAANHNQDVFIV